MDPNNRECSFADLSLTALLAATGVVLGAGIYEATVVIPAWAAQPTPEDIGPALRDSGHLRSGEVFWPLAGGPAAALAGINVIGALRSAGPRRAWWLTFALTTAAASTATAAYFVPALHRLADARTLPDSQVRRMVSRRVRLDRLRIAVVGIAWLAGLRAIAIPHADRPAATRHGLGRKAVR